MSDPSQLASEIGDLKTLQPVFTEDASTTIQSSHAGAYLRCGNMALTVPKDATLNFRRGTTINGISTNASPNTFVADSGVTINSKGASTTIGHQWGGWSLVKVAANTWDLIGDLA